MQNIFRHSVIFLATFILLLTIHAVITDWSKRVLNATTSTVGYLSSNTTSAITDSVSAVSSLVSGGFVLGSNPLFNTNTNNYIAWAWKGDVTSGFRAMAYTGTGVNRIIAHDLAATPAFMLIKRTDSVGGNWVIYHHGLTTPVTQYLQLNTTAAATADATVWNSTAPTATNFSLGTNADVNALNGSYIAYLFSEKTGFSKFGKYIGSGSADGSFVHTGFKPRFIMLKKTSGAGNNWRMWDTARATYNQGTLALAPDLNIAEYSGTDVFDINSNGFKLRTANSGSNELGSTYAYVAFADNPFKEQHSPFNLTIASSTRLNGTDAYLSKTPGSLGTRNAWSISFWLKRGSLGSLQTVWSADSTSDDRLYFDTSDRIAVDIAGTTRLVSTAVFRDPSEWMHVVVSFDAANGISANRLRVYVNGTEVTTWSTDARVGITVGTAKTSTTVQNNIGRRHNGTTDYLSGYLSDFYFIDGQVLSPGSFGESDTSSIWKPKNYTGTYGTNGFHLDFASASDPGNDVSGNNNDFTNNNIAITDNVIDTPTNNFSVMNPHDYGSRATANFRNGNLSISNLNGFSSDSFYRSMSTMKSGKWYWEITPTMLHLGYDAWIGIAKGSGSFSGRLNSNPYFSGTLSHYLYYGNSTKCSGSSLTGCPAYGSSYTVNNVIGIAFDADNGTITFYKNGVSQGTAFTGIESAEWMPIIYNGGGNEEFDINFGQGGQAGLTYNSAAGGYFKYTPPAGFIALSTTNLPASALAKSDDYFEAVTYVGTGATSTRSLFNFEPALLWLKDRGAANTHGIFSSFTNITNTLNILFEI